MPGSRGRFVARIALALVVCAVALACAAGTALAQTGHKFLSQLTQAPLGTPLENPSAVGVDKSGNLYVVSNQGGNGPAVNVFNAAGEFQTQFGAGVLEGEVTGVAVDLSGKVYVSDTGTDLVDVFKPEGLGHYALVSQWSGANTAEGSFGEVAGVAVDASESATDPRAGDVYVVDRGASFVWVFKPGAETAEGKSEGSLKGHPALVEPSAVAVQPSTGQVYVGTTAGEKLVVQEFSDTGGFVNKILGTHTPPKAFGEILALGVEDSTGNVFVTDGSAKAVDEFSAGGEWIGWLTGTETSGGPVPFAEPLGVAATATGSKVYVADGGASAVDVFGPAVTVPTVTTLKQTKVERTGATLNGSINTEGKPSSYYFEYGEPQGTRLKTAPTPAPPGESKVPVPVTGLKAGGEYSYRLVVTSEAGATDGALLQFETAPAVTAVNTEPATSISATGATLVGSLQPQGIATKYRFEYGETPAYGKASPVEYFESTASGPVAAQSAISGLTPNTTYHYRLVAFNSFGITTGSDATFKTTGPTITSEPTETLTHTSVKVKAIINPDKVTKSKYHIEYGETTSYGANSEEKEIPGETEVAIEPELKALKLATTYHFRVVLTNETGTFFGPDQEFTTVLIDGESATEVGSEKATLQALINNLKVEEAAKYRFDYGETTSYDKRAEGELKPFTGDKLAEAKLTGLHPNTTYHYRVVATVAEGTGSGPDKTFTTAAAAPFQLPDGRAYEMVSPPDKRSAFIESLSLGGGGVQSSTDGNALAYVVDGAVVKGPEGNRSFESQQALATRGSSEWTSQEIVTPSEGAAGIRLGTRPEYQFFTPDLSLSLVQPIPFGLTPLAEPPLAPPATGSERGHQEKTMYIRADAPLAPSGSEVPLYEQAQTQGAQYASEHGIGAWPGYLPLVTAANTKSGAVIGGKPIPGSPGLLLPGLQFADATPDLSHVVLFAENGIVPEGSSEKNGLYEWSGGKLAIVSVLPAAEGGTAATAPVELGTGEFNALPTDLRHALSNDGSRVVWTLNETGLEGGSGDLYLRDTTKAQTVRLDLPEEGLTKAPRGEARFQTASADGSRVFFTDPQRLTANATSTPGKPDLYVCQVGESGGKPTCKLTDLSADQHPGESANFQGVVVGASEDASSVYFVATGALASGATAGSNNLYLAQNAGGTWSTRFIATLSGTDSPDWGITEKERHNEVVTLSARVSPSGQYLTFMSSKRLTGYDNTDVNELAGATESAHQHADEEVFLYNSAGSGHITCPSCNPSGARPRGVFDTQQSGEGQGLLVDRPEAWVTQGAQTVDHWLAGSLPGYTPISPKETVYQSRYLNNEGRLFFMSADALTPFAAEQTRQETIGTTPAQVGVENVYEYEPAGVGGCTTPTGCVSQISKGSSDKESAFMDASESGNDVFFLTADKLLPQDVDTANDLYDARVCTEASPCLTPPAEPSPPCEETSTCRPGSFPAPGAGTPGSATFSGPGNSRHEVPSGETLPFKVKETKPKPLTTAQKLAAALKQCRKLPHRTSGQKRKRLRCEAQAKKKYKAKKASRARGHRSSR